MFPAPKNFFPTSGDSRTQHAEATFFWSRTVAFTRKTIRNSRDFRRIASAERRARNMSPKR